MLGIIRFESMSISTVCVVRSNSFVIKASTRSSKDRRMQRQKSAHNKIISTKMRPRLCIHKSHNHIYAQVIDFKARSLASVSTLTPTLKEQALGNNIPSAKIVGTEIAKLCLQKGIQTVVFHRSGYLYHGKVKALADAARESGLQF